MKRIHIEGVTHNSFLPLFLQNLLSASSLFHDPSSRAEPPPEQLPPPPPDPLGQYRGVLGLEKNFTRDELKFAYRELAAQYHPDRYSSSSNRVRETAEETMKRINEAYTRLKKA